MNKHIYIQFNNPKAHSLNLSEKLRWFFKYFIIKILKTFNHQINPDFDHLIKDVSYWKLEFNNETNSVQREIGYDSDGNSILAMPFGGNFGYWRDTHLKIKNFHQFNPISINADVFILDWNNFENKNNNLLFINSDKIDYDENARFYYTNLINAMILYTYDKKHLEEMEPILISPLCELAEEINYAFTPLLFDTVFRNELIDESFKKDFLAFKSKVNDIPDDIWDWEFLDHHPLWLDLRKKSEELLTKIGISTRIYNDKYTTVYDSEGELLKKEKNINEN